MAGFLVYWIMSYIDKDRNKRQPKGLELDSYRKRCKYSLWLLSKHLKVAFVLTLTEVNISCLLNTSKTEEWE